MHLTDEIYKAVIGFYERYPNVELEELVGFFDEECEWRSATRFDEWAKLGAPKSLEASAGFKSDPWAGTFKGKDGIRAYFQALTDNAETEHYTMISHLRGADELAVRVHCSIDFGKTGNFKEYWTIDWWQFREGKAVLFEEYFDTYGTIRNYMVGLGRTAEASSAL